MFKISDISQDDYPMYVGLLTVEQKDLLIGQEYVPYAYFNPLQDIDDNWIISVEEMNQCENERCIFVKDLPVILFKRKPYPPLEWE
jgi:hypothetical protein